MTYIINPTDENCFYIGDGAYAHFDCHQRLWLLTYNGIEVTNQICLEDDVFLTLFDFFKRKKDKITQNENNNLGDGGKSNDPEKW